MQMNTISEQENEILTPVIIGYTTGVFDLFHIGHLNILKRAKEQCDFLLVGVSTDELVESYKNRKTIIPFNERIEIVKSIKYVDKVVPQYTMNKFEAWKIYHFNKLFHGDDWKTGIQKHTRDEVVEELSKYGGQLIEFPYSDSEEYKDGAERAHEQQ